MAKRGREKVVETGLSCYHIDLEKKGFFPAKQEKNIF